MEETKYYYYVWISCNNTGPKQRQNQICDTHPLIHSCGKVDKLVEFWEEIPEAVYKTIKKFETPAPPPPPPEPVKTPEPDYIRESDSKPIVDSVRDKMTCKIHGIIRLPYGGDCFECKKFKDAHKEKYGHKFIQEYAGDACEFCIQIENLRIGYIGRFFRFIGMGWMYA